MAQPHFELLFQPSPGHQPTRLLSTTDPNQATVAFHAALGRLHADGQRGEVLVHKQNAERQVVLRQPVRGAAAQD